MRSQRSGENLHFSVTSGCEWARLDKSSDVLEQILLKTRKCGKNRVSRFKFEGQTAEIIKGN
jgi:hypothetical protein